MSIVGKYVKQPTGYKAFIPEPFPATAIPTMDDETIGLLENASTLLGRLDGITEILPDVEFFIYMYVRKEAVLSSQLEGTQATLIDSIKAESNFRKGVPEDVDDISRYIEAMNYGLERLKEIPISVRLITEIHSKLMTGGRGFGHATPGLIRTTQNWIGGGSPTTARFVPPPPHLVRASLSEIEKYLHSDSPASIIYKAGLTHAQFETIHPFADGNGRTGRLLITFYLCQQGILNRPVLYISDYFKRNREAYFDLLNAYHQNGEILNWLRFFFEGVAQVAEEAISVCKAVTALREQDIAKITAMGRSAPNGMVALRSLFRNPIISVRDILEVTSLSRTNSNVLMNKLVASGILVPIDANEDYGRIYIYKEYLDIFKS